VGAPGAVSSPRTFGAAGFGVTAPGCAATSGGTTGDGGGAGGGIGGAGGGGGGELVSFVVFVPAVLVCVVEELDVELDVALPVVIDDELLPVDVIETIGVASCTSAWCTALAFDEPASRPEITLPAPDLGGGHALPTGAGAGSAGPVGGVVVVPFGGVGRGARNGGVVLGLAIVASPPPPTSRSSEAPATPRESESASAAAPPATMRRRRCSRHAMAASMRSAIPVDGE
jgi:hypothetical protein